jgi:hypothetical protein
MTNKKLGHRKKNEKKNCPGFRQIQYGNPNIVIIF